MRSQAQIRQIVERAKERDLRALSALYEEYFDRVYRYILLRVRRRADAEDLAGQTFLRMLEGIEGFTWRDVAFSAWLFRIAHNLVVDWWRGTREIPSAVEPAELEADPEALAVQDESLREALTALGHLTEDQRQVVLLRLIGGLSCRETAETLGLSQSNVRTIQHRALEKIRDRLRVKIDV